MRIVKIFCTCANGENSGVLACEETEKQVNAFLAGTPDYNYTLISATPLMNSDTLWTEFSLTLVVEKSRTR